MIASPLWRSGVQRGRLLVILSTAALAWGGAPAATVGASARSHADMRQAAPCGGTARRVHSGRVRISFTCDADVTWFEIKANRPLRAFEEPSSAFGCERATSRSFRCEDIHSGAAPEGGGIATVSEPLCRRGSHLVLRITPALDFEQPTGITFTLKGPC